MIIKEIIQNTKTGQVYIKTDKSKDKKCLYKDNLGYFVRGKNYKLNRLIDRITEENDIKKIEKELLK
jgi:hypothetical protein